MESNIHKYLDQIDKLKDKVDKNSETILSKIDIDKLLENPSNYLKVIAKAFYESHGQELLEAIKIGSKHGKKILK